MSHWSPLRATPRRLLIYVGLFILMIELCLVYRTMDLKDRVDAMGKEEDHLAKDANELAKSAKELDEAVKALEVRVHEMSEQETPPPAPASSKQQPHR